MVVKREGGGLRATPRGDRHHLWGGLLPPPWGWVARMSPPPHAISQIPIF
jgi:hypothetical protein